MILLRGGKNLSFTDVQSVNTKLDFSMQRMGAEGLPVAVGYTL